MVSQWFNFSLGFANEGPDGDTVRHVLGVLHGLTIHVHAKGLRDDAHAVLPVNGVDEVNLDVVVDTFEQPDDPYNNFPVYLTGWVYDDTRALDDQHLGARVRIPLKGSRITVY